LEDRIHRIDANHNTHYKIRDITFVKISPVVVNNNNNNIKIDKKDKKLESF
jgi:hypothetical protein